MREDDAEASEEALAEICHTYWSPLYAFARRSGNSPQDSEDLTQGFFRLLIEKETLAKADPAKGKLRSFLLGAMKNYLRDEWARRTALKRGGMIDLIPINADKEEEHYQLEVASKEQSPDQIFDHQWALTLLNRVFEEVRTYYLAKGQEDIFDQLHQYLPPRQRGSDYREAGAQLGMKGSSVRVALFRMRQRYAETLRQKILKTVSSEEEVAEEIRALRQSLR